MQRLRLALSWLLCAALLTAVSVDAHAFCRTHTCTNECTSDAHGCNESGAPLLWPTRCVGFSLAYAGTQMIPFSTVETVVERAFQNWSALTCPQNGTASVTFSRLADVPCVQVGYDSNGANANSVSFSDDKWDYKGIENNLAFTLVTFDTDTGQIFDADIVVNTATNLFSTTDTNVQYDLESVLTHEVGHVLGIAHSDDPNATMCPQYTKGDISPRALSQDDIQAVCDAYPPDRAAGCVPLPHGGLRSTCPAPSQTSSSGCTFSPSPGPQPAACAVLLAAFAAWSARRRRSYARA